VLIGDVEFSQLKIILKPAQIVDGIETVPESAIRYGAFIQTVIEFFIIALSIFIVFQIIMKIKSVAIRKKAEAPAAPPPLTKTEALLTDIKQLLTEQNNAVTAAEPAPDKKPKT
jgi:large conductance mechanosensitive channel